MDHGAALWELPFHLVGQGGSRAIWCERRGNPIQLHPITHVLCWWSPTCTGRVPGCRTQS
uniref:Uncharacterized protein n=1 Tax=Strix occidentalis caurina TaxID=311401 RepID=A0A8D0F4Y4_STROC